MSDWFLLSESEPLAGSWNMAVDEYLFEQAQQKRATYVRFYTWLRPTASLGCSQEISRVVNLDECRRRGVDVVRRMTGGKMVLHHLEVTYSVSSGDIDFFTPTLEGSYRLISGALMKGLELMGLEPSLASSTSRLYARSDLPCFAYPARNEVEIRGKKIIGSAQKRSGNFFIQHGSIPLVSELDLLLAISFGLPPARQDCLTSIADELGRNISYREAVEYFIDGCRSYFNCNFKQLILTTADLDRIKTLESSKYANPDWTFHKLAPVSI
ncbi:MAG TPA: biotin/lipoate A/B protein ligase family protein [Candidatus Saccharicenans sp.]|nr:biotin/lipoate A/B protein ligase family protein [Candidatus Saccharicenans sp.]HOJ26191.1 biotin/lipoate A/B protein ligase family protein [Candidatus Saccharicenans sp.]HOT68640.1 biotin/lipoate A/B protein ligase family protein [Candidatus Saccharicenans sp.]HQE63701.1 biotin/lipoate A/B protein ligase family protein [Candidatus Saccharicenans sp.]HQH60549.1 biotin/lipoate A/B protein ligase family protein [Candidatus Saccharicenans sp.]